MEKWIVEPADINYISSPHETNKSGSKADKVLFKGSGLIYAVQYKDGTVTTLDKITKSVALKHFKNKAIYQNF